MLTFETFVFSFSLALVGLSIGLFLFFIGHKRQHDAVQHKDGNGLVGKIQSWASGFLCFEMVSVERQSRDQYAGGTGGKWVIYICLHLLKYYASWIFIYNLPHPSIHLHTRFVWYSIFALRKSHHPQA
jgi:hypothetical protein